MKETREKTWKLFPQTMHMAHFLESPNSYLLSGIANSRTEDHIEKLNTTALTWSGQHQKDLSKIQLHSYKDVISNRSIHQANKILFTPWGCLESLFQDPEHKSEINT